MLLKKTFFMFKFIPYAFVVVAVFCAGRAHV